MAGVATTMVLRFVNKKVSALQMHIPGAKNAFP